jgi:hypothetical protein
MAEPEMLAGSKAKMLAGRKRPAEDADLPHGSDAKKRPWLSDDIKVIATCRRVAYINDRSKPDNVSVIGHGSFRDWAGTSVRWYTVEVNVKTGLAPMEVESVLVEVHALLGDAGYVPYNDEAMRLIRQPSLHESMRTACTIREEDADCPKLVPKGTVLELASRCENKHCDVLVTPFGVIRGLMGSHVDGTAFHEVCSVACLKA